MPEVITDNLDLWTSALLTKSTAGRGSSGKLEAYGIKKLRELILELAVRGKLVPQDPSDEPASVLLEKIAKEKLRLIKEEKIKKEKPLPEIAEEEMDYELPSGWEFVRLGDVAYSQAGFAFKSNFFNENSNGLPLIRIRDVGQPFTGTFYSGEYREEFLIEKGDYLISMDGEFRVSPWTNGLALLNQRVSRLIFYYENVGQCFIADSLQARLRELQGVKAYTTVDHLSGTQITESVIGLPPLAEQHRIVAKVDELMGLCDQLEQQQTHSIEAHQTLVEILLGTLTRVGSQQEFSAAWARIVSHFDTLFTTEASIGQLTQTILQLAVTGKLVPQDPNDEPASVLLEKIVVEKERLIHEEKVGRGKPVPEIAADDTSTEVPPGWRVVRFGALVILVSGQHLKPEEYSSNQSEEMIPYLTGPAEFGETYPHPTRYTNERRALAEPGDVLITCKGSGVGKTNVANTQIAISRQLMSIRPIAVSTEFIKLLADSLEEAIRGNIVGIAIPGISREDVLDAVVQLPPLAEQHRIVAKFDELITLCEALKARLADAQAIQLRLADVIVEQAVC